MEKQVKNLALLLQQLRLLLWPMFGNFHMPWAQPKKLPSSLFFLVFSGGAPVAYGGSQARGRIGAAATGLSHSYSNTGSELHLRPAPQLMATLGC